MKDDNGITRLQERFKYYILKIVTQCANCGCGACLSRVSGEFSGAVTNGCARVIEIKRVLRQNILLQRSI